MMSIYFGYLCMVASQPSGPIRINYGKSRCHRAIEKTLGEAAAVKSLAVLQLTCMPEVEARTPI